MPPDMICIKTKPAQVCTTLFCPRDNRRIYNINMARHSDIVNDNTLDNEQSGRQERESSFDLSQSFGSLLFSSPLPRKKDTKDYLIKIEKERTRRPIRGGSSLFARLRCRRQMCERKFFCGLCAPLHA